MRIAVEGCCHGCLDATYNQIAFLEKKNNYKIDLVLIGGDFEAIRNHSDLLCMAVPEKYRHMGDFHKYYTGEKVAPILTIVIGGNHEASNYLWELYYGGWLAPNIYYLGAAGSVKVNGIRIAGASGIYKPNDYLIGHFETLPYNKSSMRSIYHIREYDVVKLLQLPSPEIFMSHDWPRTIEQYGDLNSLLSRKPFWREDIETGQLGSPPLMELLKSLRPKWWFAAHMHIRFEATVSHVPTSIPANPDEIQIDDDDVYEAPVPSDGPSQNNSGEIPLEVDGFNSPAQGISNPITTSTESNKETHFLALDKCLPKRQYLEIMDIPTPHSSVEASSSGSEPDFASLLPTSFGKQSKQETESPRPAPAFTFDAEWLGITRALHPYMSLTRNRARIPPPEIVKGKVEEEIEWVRKNVGDKAIGNVQQFIMTAAGPAKGHGGRSQQPMWYTNPQTEAFCAMIQIDNMINPVPRDTKVSSSLPAGETPILDSDATKEVLQPSVAAQ